MIVYRAVRIKSTRKWWIKRTQLAENLIATGTASPLKDIGSFLFVVDAITLVLFFGSPAACFLGALAALILFSFWHHTWIEHIFDDFKWADNVCFQSELSSLGLRLRF